MNKIIHRFIFFIMFVLCIFFISCRTTNTEVIAGRAASVTTEVKKKSDEANPVEGIPILAWWGVQEHTVEKYRELKECVIDYNFTDFNNVKLLTQAMDAAEAAGVKMVIHSWDLHNEPEILVSRFKDHLALAGYWISDEPHRNEFSSLGIYVRRIQAVDNKHFCYVNLPQNFVDNDNSVYEVYGTSTYRKYVQLFIDEVPVPFLSFDNYPVRVNAEGTRYLNGIWYENLESISDEARNARKPFWAFAIATAHFMFPIPTFADLRLQVYSNLAYGAQGIQYFTYWTSPPNGGFVFHDGPIDINGQRTPTWYTVQQMNKEIKALSKVFLGSQVIKVEHITKNASGEDGDIPTGTTRFDFANRPPEAKIIKKIIPANGTNAVVSFLKNGKRAYMVVINRNLDGGDDMSITVTGGAGLQLIKKDGKAVNAFFESSKQTVTPGDALIYGWDIK